jgi:hypothetical protein
MLNVSTGAVLKGNSIISLSEDQNLIRSSEYNHERVKDQNKKFSLIAQQLNSLVEKMEKIIITKERIARRDQNRVAALKILEEKRRSKFFVSLVDEKNFSVVGENLTFDFPTKYGEEINST